MPAEINAQHIRSCFESAVRGNPVFKSRAPLAGVEVRGSFSHYAASTTDTLWVGFVLGWRCMERIANADFVELSRAPRVRGQRLTTET